MKRFNPGDIAIIRCQPEFILPELRKYIGEMCSVVEYTCIYPYDYQIRLLCDGWVAYCIDPILHHVQDPDPPKTKTKQRELEEVT